MAKIELQLSRENAVSLRDELDAIEAKDNKPGFNKAELAEANRLLQNNGFVYEDVSSTALSEFLFKFRNAVSNFPKSCIMGWKKESDCVDNYDLHCNRDGTLQVNLLTHTLNLYIGDNLSFIGLQYMPSSSDPSIPDSIRPLCW